MSFSDHKITAFTHRIADLPDQPNLPADELKARFDSSPEQLRVSLNAVCDEADRLDGRVDGIIAGAFGDSIDKSMLSNELAAELDAKATQTALSAVAGNLADETSARTSADTALSNRVSSLETALPQKARLVYGSYDGNGADNRLFTLGFRPRLVFIQPEAMYFYGVLSDTGTLMFSMKTSIVTYPAHLQSNGFQVSASELLSSAGASLNESGKAYNYVAIGL